MKKKKLIAAALIFVVGLVGVTIVRNGGKPPQYQTEIVGKGTIISSVTASGKLLSTNSVSVTTNATGVVKRLFIKEGDMVSVGQKIAEIALDLGGRQKNAQAWSSYLSAKNTLDAAKATAYSLQSDMLTKWKTYMDLAQSGSYQNSDGSPKTDARQLPQFFSPSDDWLAAEAKYKNQTAVIDQAAAAVNSAWLTFQQSAPIVTAPMEGKVASISVAEGMVLAAGSDTAATPQRVAVVEQESAPFVSVNVTELDVPKVKIGQKATVTFDSVADKTFTGNVVAIDRAGTVSNSVTSYPAIVQLDTATGELLPNMAASATIILDTKTDVLLVPSAAVQIQNGSATVRITQKGKEATIPVEVGFSSDTQTEIVSGLVAGDEVITGTITVGASTSGTSGRSVFGGFGSFGGGQMRR